MMLKRKVTRAEVRELDRKAIEVYGIPGVVLMENAGRSVAEEAMRMLTVMPSQGKPRVAILCGKGNNGGDGFVATRYLLNYGLQVYVYLFCTEEEVSSSQDAFTHLPILKNMGQPILEVTTLLGVKTILPQLREFDLLIDALLGTGLSGEMKEPYKTLIQGINETDVPVLSVDIPSGLDCDEGLVLGAAIKATKTVTFILPKVGFFKNDGPFHVGELFVADIGIPKIELEKTA